MNNRIVSTMRILGGRPRINGTQIGVEHIMQYVNGAATIDEIMEQYPDISEKDNQACVEYSKCKREKLKVKSFRTKNLIMC